MKVREFYEYLLTQMSVEEALLKLLEGHVMTYDKLKFNEGEELHPLMVASMAAMDMGWQMAIPDGDDEVQGIIMGTSEYLKEILGEDDDNGCSCKNGCSSSNCQNR